jgi:teichuronic acid biosynthesis glycosyltransferase TuaG
LSHSAKRLSGPHVADQLVSIVIPTYNCAHLLPRALQSVMEQTYGDWEALIVDNHSTDNTDEVVGNFRDKRIRLLKIHNNGVIAVSRNLGIREAKGRWVAFLDADDWWTQEKLEFSVTALRQGNDIVYHDLFRVGPQQRLSASRLVPTRDLRPPVYQDLVMHGNALLNSSVVVSREILSAVGGLSENPRLVAAEDFECWLRIARQTERFARLPDVYGYYWIGHGNTSSSSRTLTCLGELRDHYLGTDTATNQPLSPPWLSFALGKAHFLSGQYQSSLEELARISPASDAWTVYLKAAVIRTLSYLALKMKIA